jgi:purine-binding chemotaxis protein CheW
MTIYTHFSEKERQVLLARAERLTNLSDDEMQEDQMAALSVTVRQEYYALPIDTLTAVHERIAIIPMPCVPAHVAGIANIRGHIVPVLDLGVLLNVPGEAEASDDALVVGQVGEETVALRVDWIGDVTTFSIASIAPIPANIENDQAARYLQGILESGEALVSVEAILRDSDLTISELVN